MDVGTRGEGHAGDRGAPTHTRSTQEEAEAEAGKGAAAAETGKGATGKGARPRLRQDLMAFPMPMERGRQATMKEMRGLRRASRLRDRSADVSMSGDW